LLDQREFHQEIRERGGTLAANGVITVVTIDPATRKSRPVPDELAAACRSCRSCGHQLDVRPGR
jgi:acyl-CoA thioesterase FadM